MTLPHTVPYWQAALGSVFAIVVVKCLCGGLGQNIFNPALAARAFLLLIYPVICLVLFNIGVGFILSALFVIFKDVQYLYDIFTQLLMYVSAIFYTTSVYPEKIQLIFFANPVYSYIAYFRSIVLEGTIPPAWHHLLCFGYAVIMLITGMAIYKKYNYKFMYYI